jgi:hypothetical protein
VGEIADRGARGTPHGADQIGLAVGPAVKRYRMRKHFAPQITDTTVGFERIDDQIAVEAALDGIYVLRTSADTERLPAPEVVRSTRASNRSSALGTSRRPRARPRRQRSRHRLVTNQTTARALEPRPRARSPSLPRRTSTWWPRS